MKSQLGGTDSPAELKTQFVDAINKYFYQSQSLSSLEEFMDENRYGCSSVLSEENHRVCLRMADADRATGSALAAACRVGPRLAHGLRAVGQPAAAENVGAMVALLTTPVDRRGAFELRPKILAALAGPEKPAVALASRLQNLRGEFAKLSEMKDRNATGLAFEKLLTSLFELYDLAPREGFRVIGEQIDGAFELDHEIYLVEAKWERNPVAEAELLVFRGKIEGKSSYTRGVFIAINGVSKPAEQAIRTGKQACFFIVDGHDLNAVLEGKIHLGTLLRNKQRRLAEEGKIMATYDEF